MEQSLSCFDAPRHWLTMPEAHDHPQPIALNVSVLDGITAIARVWAPGDTARCRLCPQCTALDDLCNVQTRRTVTDAEAPLFARRGPPGDSPAPGILRLAL